MDGTIDPMLGLELPGGFTAATRWRDGRADAACRCRRGLTAFVGGDERPSLLRPGEFDGEFIAVT